MISKSHQHRSEHRVLTYVADNDIHLAIGGTAGIESATAAVEIDAAADRRWFRKHRNKNERHRLASVREQRAAGVPAGTVVRVLRNPDGSQTRIIRAQEKYN